MESCKNLVVGGGISGLLVASRFLEKGLPFLGLEEREILGGRLLVGHHRLYREDSVSYLKGIDPELFFERVEDSVQERSKGEWVRPTETGSQSESFYLGQGFFAPGEGFSKFFDSVSQKVAKHFLLQKKVTTVRLEAREIDCFDGSQFQFERLFWCAPLVALSSVLKEGVLTAPGGVETQGGISLTMELIEPVFETKNTVVFPFRFKEHKLRALGVRHGNRLDWLVFLPSALLDNNEEVAKAVRALKRELYKEFTGLEQKLVREKLTYLPRLSSEEPIAKDAFTVAPSIFYLGPEWKVGVEDGLQNLDLILSNLRHLEPQLSNM